MFTKCYTQLHLQLHSKFSEDSMFRLKICSDWGSLISVVSFCYIFGQGRLHRGAGGAAAPPSLFEEGQRWQEVP